MLDAKTLAWAEAIDPALIAKTASQRHVQSVIEDLVSVVCRRSAEIERLAQQRAELDALRGQKPGEQAVPAGWRLVPLEPVQEMVDAGEAAYWAKVRDTGSPTPTEFPHECGGPAGYAWLAMLHAAPQPPAHPVKRLTDEQIREVLLSASRDAAVKLGVPADELGEPDEDSLHSATMAARWVEPAMAAAWGVKLKEPT